MASRDTPKVRKGFEITADADFAGELSWRGKKDGDRLLLRRRPRAGRGGGRRTLPQANGRSLASELKKAFRQRVLQKDINRPLTQRLESFTGPSAGKAGICSKAWTTRMFRSLAETAYPKP